MYQKAKKFTLSRPMLRKTLAFFCLLTGIIGLVLPLIPGILLLILSYRLFECRISFFERFLVPIRIKTGKRPLETAGEITNV